MRGCSKFYGYLSFTLKEPMKQLATKGAWQILLMAAKCEKKINKLAEREKHTAHSHSHSLWVSAFCNFLVFLRAQNRRILLWF